MIDHDKFTTSDLATVLVTGCASGIGRAIVTALDQAGYQVLAGVRRERDAESLRAGGSPNVIPLMLDVTDEPGLQRAVAEVQAVVGTRGLYAVINNAGIAVAGPLEHLPLSRLQRQFDVNLFGVLRVCQAFLPLLRQANRGGGKRPRILNIGSVASRLTLPLLGGYAASKAALVGISDALRLELRPWNLYVSLIEPGSVITPIVDKGIEASRQDVAALSDTARHQYDDAIDAVTTALLTNSQKGIAAEVVARKVLQVLQASRPRGRYLVGSESRLVALLARYTPLSWRDALLARVLRLPRRGSKV